MAISEAQFESAKSAVVAVLRAKSPFIWAEPVDEDASEFTGEVNAVAKQIGRLRGPKDAAHALERVFVSSFGSPDFQSGSWPEEAGQLLWAELVKRRLV